MDDEKKIILLGDLGGAENFQLPDPTLMAYYTDLQKRIFWLTDEINDDSYSLVQYIIRINHEDYGVPIEERKPIRIYFNSPGGSLDVADTLCSIIEASKTPVYGYALGLVASAASLIYLACSKRFALDTAYWILHKGSANMSGDYNSITNALEDYQRQIQRLVNYYIEKTDFPSETIEEKIKTDWYIHSDEALKYNVAHELITDIDTLYA